jgi:glycosyltransferase involved in cell wall biosynthesis
MEGTPFGKTQLALLFMGCFDVPGVVGKRGSDRLKIFIVAHHTKSLLIFSSELLVEFVKRGDQVTVCAPENDPDLVERISKMGIDFIQLPLDRNGMNPVKDLYALGFLVKTIAKIDPDIVFNFAIKPGIYGTLAARLGKVPKIYSMMMGLGYSFMASNLLSRIINVLVCSLCRFIFPKNTKVFFLNPDDRSLFVQLRLVPEPQAVHINGQGIDLEYFYKSPPQTDGPVFLMIARLIKDKGVFEYVEAARILKQRHPTAIFRLVGPFDSNPTAISKSQIEIWQKEGLIDYCGETKDVRPFISSSSVYVLPSYREGAPRSVLEAMSMGRPIVTTDAPGCRETVIDSKNGFLVPVKNVDALVKAMEYFIVNPDSIEKMGQCSRDLVVEKFDVNKVNDKIMKEMGFVSEKTANVS